MKNEPLQNPQQQALEQTVRRACLLYSELQKVFAAFPFGTVDITLRFEADGSFGVLHCGRVLADGESMVSPSEAPREKLISKNYIG